MSQSEQTAQVTSKESVLSFLSALKSGAKAQTSEGGLFASLLSETKTAPVDPKVPERMVEIERPSVRQADDRGERPDVKDTKLDERQQNRPSEKECARQDVKPQQDGLKKKDTDAKAPVQDEQKAVAVTEDKDVAAEGTQEMSEDAAVAEVVVASASKDDDTETTNETDSTLLAFLASLNPLAETSEVTVENGEKIVAEDGEKDVIDVAAHIETEIKSLLATRKQTEDGKTEKPSEAVITDDAEVKASIENALAIKAEQRGGKEGALTKNLESGENLDVDSGDMVDHVADRLVAGKEENPYGKDAKESEKGFDFEDAFLPRKQEQGKSTQTPLMTNMSGANLKKAIENLTGANGNAKTEAVGEATQTNHLNSNIQSADRYSFSSQLSAVRVTKGGNTGLPTPAEQIAVQINKMAKDGKDEMTINLKPAELGKVQVKLEFSGDQKVHALVTADNQNSLDLLMKDQESLQRALENAGFSLEQGGMEFSLNENNQGQSFEQERMASNDRSIDGLGKEELMVEDVESETYYVTPGRVNLRV